MKAVLFTLLVLCSVFATTYAAATAVDLTVKSNFTCVPLYQGFFNPVGEVVYDYYTSYNLTGLNGTFSLEYFVQTLGYFLVAPNNQFAVFGLQYNNASVLYKGTLFNGNYSVTYDALGAFLSPLQLFEFVPSSPNKTFSPNDTVLKVVNLVSATALNVCSSDATYHYLTLKYQDGLTLKCRVANTQVNETNGVVVSPASSKCDLTFGTFPYSGRNDTRLGLSVAFVVAAAEDAATNSANTTVQNCKNGTGFCLFVNGSTRTGEFTWVNSTTNTTGVVASGLTAYTGTSADFVLPQNPGDPNNPVTVTVNKFAAASVVVFSFANPPNGDVWDPVLASNSNTNTNTNTYPNNPPANAGSTLRACFLLIAIVALLSKFL